VWLVYGRRSLKQSLVNGVDRPRNSTSSGRKASARSAAEQRRPPLDGEPAEGPGASSSASAERCRHCEAMSGELDRARREFDADRRQWLAEKRRVIAYQKLLQSRYVSSGQHNASCLHQSSFTLHDATISSVSRPFRRCELDSRQLKTVSYEKIEV